MSITTLIILLRLCIPISYPISVIDNSQYIEILNGTSVGSIKLTEHDKAPYRILFSFFCLTLLISFPSVDNNIQYICMYEHIFIEPLTYIILNDRRVIVWKVVDMATFKSKKGKSSPDLKYLRVVLHLTAASVLSFGIYTDYNTISPPGMKTNPFGGKFKYLTFICAVRNSY